MADGPAIEFGLGVLSNLHARQRAGAVRDPNAGDPAEDVVAAGRLICEALGVDPRPRAGAGAGLGRSRPRLVAAARAIANGAAGRSAATALMIFGDAAGKIDSDWRIERSMAGLVTLAGGQSGAIAEAVDRILERGPREAPAPIPRPAPDPAPRRPWSGLVLIGAAVLVLLLISSQAIFRPAPNRHPTATASAIPITSALAVMPAPPPTAAPDAVVTTFYKLAAERKFDAALALWDEHLRTSLPGAQYPDQRFAGTTELTVSRAAVTSQDDVSAIVATDLTEVTGGVVQHWTGSWRLVRTGGVWLLDQPDFRAA